VTAKVGLKADLQTNGRNGSFSRIRRPVETDFSCGLDSVGPGCDLQIDDAIANP
jgi:hypothetical protein